MTFSTCIATKPDVMARRDQPLFVERSGYRQRRVIDSLRLVAIFGTVLWMVPMIWPSAEDAPDKAISTSGALLYVFGVWVLLIALAALLHFRLRRAPIQSDDPDGVP